MNFAHTKLDSISRLLHLASNQTSTLMCLRLMYEVNEMFDIRLYN